MEDLERRLDEVCDYLDATLGSLSERLGAVERRLGDLTEHVGVCRCAALREEIQALRRRLAELEQVTTAQPGRLHGLERIA